MVQMGVFDAAKYAALPGIEDAHEALRTSGRLGAIDRILTCIEDWGLEATLGVAVLHNHFSVQDSAFPIQRREVIDGQTMLITEAGDADGNAMPHIMKFEGATARESFVLPLEYSCDPKVSCAHVRLSETEGFWKDVAAVVFAAGVEDALGLAIIERSGVSNTEIVWIETTHRAPSGALRNVLRAVDAANADMSGTIQTIYASSKIDAACNGSCSPSGTYCLPYGTHHERQVNHNRRHQSF